MAWPFASRRLRREPAAACLVLAELRDRHGRRLTVTVGGPILTDRADLDHLGQVAVEHAEGAYGPTGWLVVGLTRLRPRRRWLGGGR
jgi:hypothetical protein